PPLPSRPFTLDLSSLCAPQSEHEYRNVRRILKVLADNGLATVGVPQEFDSSSFSAPPSLFPVTSSQSPSVSTSQSILARIASTPSQFVGEIDVQEFLSTQPPPSSLHPIFQGTGNRDLLFDGSD
ncbi:hypothetical protein PENTCL1PPCAC_20041, partial [Pristionchus entomophagus]